MPSSNARKHMVLGQLYTNEIVDPRILAALAEVPREPFLPQALRASAYVDEQLEVSPGRWLLPPLACARLLALAEIQRGDRVLLVGALSGYMAALLAKLAGQVVAVESNAEAVEYARGQMRAMGLSNVEMHSVATLSAGYEARAPYDVIVIAGAVEVIPETLTSQLAANGRMVTVRQVASRPGGSGGLGRGLLVRRLDHKLQYREHFDAAAALLPDFRRPAGFVF